MKWERFTSRPSKYCGLNPCYTSTSSLSGSSLKKIKFSWSWRDSNPELPSLYNRFELYSRQKQIWFCSSQHNHNIWDAANFLSNRQLAMFLCHRSSCVLKKSALHAFVVAVGSNLKYLLVIWVLYFIIRKLEWTSNTQTLSNDKFGT
jgi:hypothetical protein